MIKNNVNAQENGIELPKIEGLSKELFDLIPEGEENAVHMKTLADCLNVEGRDIRREVLNLRNKERIIASSQNGYFIPTTKGELLKYYRESRGRALTTLKSLKKTRRVLRAMGFNPDDKEGSNNEETI